MRLTKTTAHGTRGGAGERLPLSVLLSQVLVAFTIEFDNEFERLTPHRTSRYGATAGSVGGPWLVSIVMWLNCMKFVGEGGVGVGELEKLARTPTNLNGMERWGYVVVEPDPADPRAKPPRSAWLIRATAKGRAAQEAWRPLFGVIERRWIERFGAGEIAQLRASLCEVIVQTEIELPECLPILGYGLYGTPSSNPQKRMMSGAARSETRDVEERSLATLLSQALLVFAIEFESESEVSLAISANVLRVLDEKGAAIRDLPMLSGVSKEAISMALGFLQKRGLVVLERDKTKGSGKIARLTARGRKLQDEYHEMIGAIEKRWEERYGLAAIGALRESLERLAGDGTAQNSPLFRGLEPHPDGWRAKVRKPETLPHFPMVLHRGGFPDGS